MKIPSLWTFDDPAVADGFDDHVREQLPWYDLVTDGLTQIGRHYIGNGGRVYDIGASTGNVGRALAPILRDRSAEFVAIEESPEMASRYRGPGELVVGSVEDFEFSDFDLTVAMLALMFLRPSDVPTLIERLVSHIAPGGALVIVERMLPPSGYLSIVTSRMTLAAKASAGAPAEQIVAKELSLAGVQRPLDPRMLTAHGAVEWFRFGDFAGYVIEGQIAKENAA